MPDTEKSELPERIGVCSLPCAFCTRHRRASILIIYAFPLAFMCEHTSCLAIFRTPFMQKCDEIRVGESCSTCIRLNIDCLGWGPKRPAWMRVSTLFPLISPHCPRDYSSIVYVSRVCPFAGESGP